MNKLLGSSPTTTIAGVVLAALIACQPILEGSGYHMDKATISKLVFAAMVAVFSRAAKDSDGINKKKTRRMVHKVMPDDVSKK